MFKKNIDLHNHYNQIFTAKKPEIEKLAEGFHFIASTQLENTRLELELLQAIGDREAMVKEQIKQSTIQHMLGIFDECYFKSTGKLWQKEVDNG